MVYVLSNHLAGGYSLKNEKKVRDTFPDEEIKFFSCQEVEDKKSFVEAISENDKLVVIGGDGTLSRFVNAIDDKDYPFPIFCYAGGTGNDFINDVTDDETSFIQINEYIKELPIAVVNGKEYKILNGVSMGLDGYCCDVGDKRRKKTGKVPNYLRIAIGGFLYGYKPCRATVTVDGKSESFESVWLAPTMNGRFYGGHQMITPTQDRLNPERRVCFAVAHAKRVLSILPKLPSVRSGKHMKYNKIFKIIEGEHVVVEFEKPAAVQIDGEPIGYATSYEVFGYKRYKNK